MERAHPKPAAQAKCECDVSLRVNGADICQRCGKPAKEEGK